MAENSVAAPTPSGQFGWDVDWPLRGREPELAVVVTALRNQRGAVLAGPAGVGRTRLARTVRAAVAERFGPGAWVVGSEPARTMAFGAFAQLVGGVERAGLHAAQEPGAAWTGPGDLQRAVAAVAARCGGLLCVDDAHLLDDASAALLHHLVLQRAVPVVVTVRTGQPRPAPGAVTALWKDEHLDRVDLAPLPEQMVLEVLEACAGDQVERRSVTRLRSLCGGNLALMQSLVVAEAAAGHWQQVAGVWMLTGRPTVPPRIADLLDHYVPVPQPETSQAVELVAVAGELDLRVLERLTDVAAVEEAERCGLLSVSRSGRARVRVALPLYGELVRARIGFSRTRRLKASVAEAVLGEQGRPAEAPARRTPVQHAATDVTRAAVAVERGQVRSAARLLRDAIAVFTVYGQASEGHAALTQLAAVLGMQGDADGAAAVLERAAGEGCRRARLMAQAWAAAAAGTVSEATALAQRAAVLARAEGAVSAEVAALHAAVRFGDASGARRLAELAAAEAAFAPAAAHAAALSAGDGGALDRASRMLEERGTLLLAADAAAQAATTHRHAGVRPAALAAAARAELLGRRCEGAATPALRAAANPLPLTAREREVTQLAARGLTNREIAKRLVVSVRTVEGHLYRACAKLHVETRAELEGVLG